jgi:hypothetical protein
MDWQSEIYIEFLSISVQFCGTSPSEPPFLTLYLNMFHQLPSPKYISLTSFAFLFYLLFTWKPHRIISNKWMGRLRQVDESKTSSRISPPGRLGMLSWLFENTRWLKPKCFRNVGTHSRRRYPRRRLRPNNVIRNEAH